MGINTSFMPTKCRLRYCTIAGQPIARDTASINTYESMCLPYRRAQITVVDNSGWISEMAASRQGSLAGLPVQLAFDAGEDIYEMKEQVIQSVKSTPSPENRTVKIYQIGTIGSSYVNDRKNLVQKAFTNIPASSAASLIHNQFLGGDAPLSCLRSSIGMIAKDTIGSFPISNIKPFKAIEDILSRVTYGGITANPTVYFRNADSYVLAPLQQIFQSSGSGVTIVEKATWGTSIGDMFDNAHYGVIAATLLVSPEDADQAGSNISSRAAAASQGLNIFNTAGNIQSVQKFASLTSLGGLISSIGGTFSRQGGSMNNFLFNILQNELSADPSIGRVQEQEFLATVADADKYLIKYPLRAGLKTTAGGSLNARLIGPTGRQIGGQMLLSDVMHECNFNDRAVQGTTTCRGIRISDVA